MWNFFTFHLFIYLSNFSYVLKGKLLDVHHALLNVIIGFTPFFIFIIETY
jgi:hypothetical protein